jgi:hypothetical protein
MKPDNNCIILNQCFNNRHKMWCTHNAVEDIVLQIVNRKMWFSSHISSRKRFTTLFSAKPRSSRIFMSQATYIY